MNAPHWQRDEETGLYKWPVLLNGDWSRWTDTPCTILWGQIEQRDYSALSPLIVSRLGGLLTSSDWPDITVFRVGNSGFLAFAPSYTCAQTSLLAQNINRELSQIQPSKGRDQRKISLTWSTIEIKEADWDLPCILQALISSVERGIRERRLGSIEEIDAGRCESGPSDFYVSYGRDPVTNLDVWPRLLVLCSRYGDEPVAILMGDVDRMKNLNDMYGPATGDLALQLLSHVLRRFESNDVAVFRLGGDEFLIWIRGYSLDRAKRLAQQIDAEIGALQIPVQQSDCSCSVSLTWGAAAASSRDLDITALLYGADELLQKAKEEKRGLVGT